MHDHLIEGDDGGDAADVEVPVRNQRIADPHDQQRDIRQRLVRAEQLFEDFLEVRHDEDHQADDGEDGDRKHHRRVDHRRFHLAGNSRRLLHEARQTVENDLHGARRLAGAHHVQIELVKRLRVLRQRFREGRSAFDRLRRLTEHLLDRGVARLLLQRVQ